MARALRSQGRAGLGGGRRAGLSPPCAPPAERRTAAARAATRQDAETAPLLGWGRGNNETLFNVR